ncbi:tetratricopeptide repeat protein [Stutzerimonas azotifigens]|uniref:tetratricopeptide repeat protein n=1 Tax=Stutzerimonas azotifigens TaxID=291995 RepID=UPI0003FE7E25|nr:tetratricopeptide repeat protein [Stutzerimonas azotifigens]
MRYLLLLLLITLTPVQAAQSIDAAVLRALETARHAQEAGRYEAAREALEGAEARPGSFEQALLWRSLGYLAWARGDNRQALQWLEKAVDSGKLDATAQANERLNLARLNLVEGRFGKVVQLLSPLPANPDEDLLKMLVQAYQGLGQHSKALPLAERYLKTHPQADDAWLQFLVAGNAELERYDAAQRWQRRLLARHPDRARDWWQLAGLQQLAGDEEKALGTLRAAQLKGVAFDESQLDNLVLMASAAGQPWQGARMLEGMLKSGLLARTATREERLGMLWWQARERDQAAQIYRRLAGRSGSAKHWMNLAQLELEQARWQAGLDALKRAEQAGAERSQVRAWREWAEGELSFERERRQLARVD